MKYLTRLATLPLLLFLLTACTATPPPQPVAADPAASQSTPAVAPAPEIIEEIAPEAAKEIAGGDLDAKIPPTPAVRTGRFDNGLTYYVRTHRKPEQRAELRLVVNAGSILEDDDQRGLAHFVEHMAFNGTENFEKQEIVDYLESIGLAFGPDLNAYTSFDETVYMLKVPTDDWQIVETAFQILEDWAHAVSFDGEEIDKERGVVVEEWRLDRGAGARLRDKQLPVIFKDSHYAERMTIGDVETLQNAPHDTLRRFYRDWYRPDLMAVVAVGDFDADVVEELIEQHFASIPPTEKPRERESHGVPGHVETLFSIESDPEISGSSVAVHYKHPAIPEGAYRNYRQAIVQSLYHGMLNDRLDELAQEAEPPFLYAASSMSPFVRTASVFSQQARVREGEILPGLEALLTEVERVDRHGFTQTELDRAKINTERAYEQTYRERDKVRSAPLAAELVRAFLESEPIPGIEVELELVRRFLPTIELEEVNRLASEWITDENRVFVVTQPEKDDLELPTDQEILAVFDAIEQRDVEPFVDRVLDAPLLADIPAPGEVVEESEIAEIGVTEWRLSNGVRVVLKPTDFQNDQIAIAGFSPGGHSLIDDQRYTSAVFSTTILGESGLGEFSQIELGKALAGKVAGAQVYIGELEEGVSAFASPQDLETMFQLLYLRLTAPRLEQEAFESLMAKMEIVVKNRLSRPGTVFGDKLAEALTQGHRRRQPLSEETLGEIDPEAALEIYRDRFADVSDFTFIVVGNFEPEALRPLVRTYLASLPSTGREETWKDIGVERPDGVVEFEVEKGLEPKAQVTLIFSGEAEWSRESQHQLNSLARALQIRLRELLREDLGATYGTSVSGGISWRPKQRYSVSIQFGCAPEEVDSLVESVFEEIARVHSDGVEQTYIERIQEIQRRQRETSVKENGFWLGGLQTYYNLGLDPRLILEFDALVEGITPESLKKAASRYLNPERYVLGVLSPEEQAAGEAVGGK
ncbi:MAG: insulinase family protein [bacterium]|nr:insulinase family protein [bacterium]